jgi:hypothetical protein
MRALPGLALVLGLACWAAVASANGPWQLPDAGPLKLDLRVLSAPAAPQASGGTRCEKCHTTAAWDQAAFDHDKTGFPLRGAHVHTDCKSCHIQDLSTSISTSCAGCHHDVHLGEFGQQCQGCHKEETWTPLFNVNAHRRTNFPLTGRHAFIPCTECHVAMTDRNFALDTVQCIGCHRADFNATQATQVNHVQLGFSQSCGACHTGVRWQGAHFPQHDQCFQIIGGAHASIQCLTCHTSLANAQVNGMCATGTATCSSCHEHLCPKMDPIHTNVPGYQCRDAKCYACHKITSTP